MAHTKGPWIYGVWETDKHFSILQADSLEQVAATKTKENAQLIAAAPELLEALECMYEVFGMEYGCENMESVQMAIKAIAKAKGGEE